MQRAYLAAFLHLESPRCLHAHTLFAATGTGKVTKVKKGTWLDQTKARQELGRKPLSAHQQRQLAHTAAGMLGMAALLIYTAECQMLMGLCAHAQVEGCLSSPPGINFMKGTPML